MTDKEHEGIEKEKNTPDTETPEDGTQTTGAGSGKGLAEDKSEQQTSDAKKSEGQTETTGTDLGEGLTDNDPVKGTTDAEGLEGDNKGLNTEPTTKTNLFQVFVGLAQIIAAIAAAMSAILAFNTLQEMQIERENAYHPEIVIEPKTFEGGEDSKRQLGDDKTYMFIDCDKSDPMSWFRGTTISFNDNRLNNSIWTAWSKDIKGKTRSNLLYLEVPYLSLRNIGLGTAKDVQVTFLADSIIEEFTELNHNSELFNENGDDFDAFWIYLPPINDITKSAKENQFRIYTDRDSYSNISKNILLAGADIDINITYITNDDIPVRVNIPNEWCNMLAISYALRIRSFLASNMREDADGIGFHAKLPDLKVIIQYSDIQGIQYKQEEAISWDIQFEYNKSKDSNEDEGWMRSLRTDFYYDYMR